MSVVSGQVRDHAGQGVPGVLVTAVPVGGRRFSAYPSTHTDLSGRWALDLADGDWRIRESGFGGHQVVIAGAPVKIGEPAPTASVSKEPSREDIERLLARRKVMHEIRDERDVDAPPSETRPLVESPVDAGDMTAFLRARRGE